MGTPVNFAQRLMGLGLVPQAVEPIREQANHLSPYGLSMPTADQINPNVFFPNTGFFGNHPRITNALEGALMGAAFTAPSNNAGEAISNIAQGLLKSRDYQQQNILKQYMSPFAMAGQMATLQQAQDQHDVATAQAAYYKAHGDYFGDAGVRAETRANATRPVVTDTGSWLYDVKDGWQFKEGLGIHKPSGGIMFGPFSVKTVEERQAMMHFQDRVDKGGPMPTAEEWNADVDRRIGRHAGSRAGAARDAALDVGEEHGDYPEAVTNELTKLNQDYGSLRKDPENKTTRSSYRRQILGDPNFANADFNQIEAEIDNRITQHNQQLETERDTKRQEVIDRWQHRGRSAAVPKPTAKAKTPGTPTPVAPSKPGRPKVTLGTDGSIQIG